jgi:hypothetical protein
MTNAIITQKIKHKYERVWQNGQLKLGSDAKVLCSPVTPTVPQEFKLKYRFRK